MKEEKTYREKKEEMMRKYEYAIYALSVANDADIGVAFDMLKANINGIGEYSYVNQEELRKDYEELVTLE